jgi:hypothetical protein
VLPVNPKVNDKWYNIRRFYGRENPRKFGNGIFGCIPHGARAYQGIDLREIRKYKKKGTRR